jgi:hypothetical protein
MYKYLSDRHSQIGIMLLLAIACSLAAFLLQAHYGFNLWDEGFLWYGAQRVMAGEVPILDFMAYDIGRYYWSSAFMSLLGDNGIVTLRVATAAFQALALFIGLAALSRSFARQNLFWLLAAITLEVWMYPQYRLFDISLPIMLVGSLSFLVEAPSRRRYFLTGLIVGLVAIFGRNHGVYGAAGSLGVMIYLATRHEPGPRLITAFAFWALGLVAGYLPVLMFLAFVPGFATAFWQSILLLFEIKATNIPLPVPWPWLVSFGQPSTVKMLRGVVTGILFIAIVAFGVLGIVWVFWKRIQNNPQNPPASPALVASVFLALPYAHYAYSRADMAHLAPGIPPFLMGITALLASQPAKIKWPFAAMLCGASFLIMLPENARWYCHSSQQCVQINVARDSLMVDFVTANTLFMLHKLSDQFAPGERTFIAEPFWPGAYAALERKSPMWENFAFYPRSDAFQQAEIERIKAANPGFAVIWDLPLDGRNDLRFSHTHPIIDQYFRDNFEPLNGYALDPALHVYASKQTGQ